MNKYFTNEIDVNGTEYLQMRKDVEPFRKKINETIWNLLNEYEKEAEKSSYYYLGYNICFTYKNKKYYYDLDFKNKTLEKITLIKLEKLNCNDIYVKNGEID